MTDVITSDGLLSADRKSTLFILVDMMIPEEGVMPSAADPAIFAAILEQLTVDEVALSSLLSVIEDLSEKNHERSFARLNDDERAVVIKQFRSSHDALAQFLQFNTLNSYYQDDRVMEAIGLEARAPYPGGYEVAPTDWTILEPVRGREKIYRDA